MPLSFYTQPITMRIESLYLALRKRIRLLFSGRFFVFKKGDVRYLLDIYGYIDRRVEAFGLYERAQLTYFIDQITRLNPTLFIDAGANFGLYSVNVAHRFPGMHVIAFEPDARNRAQLISNVFLNELEDVVRVEGVALSDCEGSARFYRHGKENPGRSMLSPNGEYSVAIRTLDDVINISGQVIAIKIDVEGHELPLLRGAERLIKANHCLVQIESFSPEEVFNYLNGLGYSLEMKYGNDYFFSPRHAEQAQG